MPRASSFSFRHPTYVSLVLEYLVKVDDFTHIHAIVNETTISISLVRRALLHLKHHHAVDAVDAQGVLYWFATPESDNRLHTMKEIAEYTKTNHKPARKRASTAKVKTVT